MSAAAPSRACFRSRARLAAIGVPATAPNRLGHQGLPGWVTPTVQRGSPDV
jgi:hypothetical protein